MFTLEDLELEQHYGKKMEINGEWFTLTNLDNISIWISDSYKVYATPNFDNVPVPVEVITANERPLGIDSYPVEIEDFDRYCHIVKVLTEKILRRVRI